MVLIVITTILIISIILSSYDNDYYFWGYFVIGESVIFTCLAIGIYLLSLHFKEIKPKLSKFLWGLGIYVLLSIVGLVVYAVLNSLGVISV